MNNFRIAITNDDGIDSPGLRAAAKAVADMGEVIVIAPTNQQTGMGRSLTGDHDAHLQPIKYRINSTDIQAYHCNGSPALVVRHAMQTIFNNRKPDLLISGINYGENLGHSVTCSGTVGAALEAGNYNVPAIAISKQTDIRSHLTYTEQDWLASTYFLKYFSSIVLEKTMLPDVDVLKIDVPDSASPKTKWKITRLARTSYYKKKIDNPTAASKISEAKTTISVDKKNLDPESDIYVLAVAKQVSVTPLSLDLTSRVDSSELRNQFDL